MKTHCMAMQKSILFYVTHALHLSSALKSVALLFASRNDSVGRKECFRLLFWTCRKNTRESLYRHFVIFRDLWERERVEKINLIIATNSFEILCRGRTM
ncbi:unnamed protein product [Albugo candida]|uniref:Secreted protein n=1 Tax=Albugo candida TaxID=65357 RepID=A0A024GTE3_9STRA|nr:unnamed protein product [Albugo candida]|eukprot:CCI50228.1 unnamed protein product [Albugo candida]